MSRELLVFGIYSKYFQMCYYFIELEVDGSAKLCAKIPPKFFQHGIVWICEWINGITVFFWYVALDYVSKMLGKKFPMFEKFNHLSYLRKNWNFCIEFINQNTIQLAIYIFLKSRVISFDSQFAILRIFSCNSHTCHAVRLYI